MPHVEDYQFVATLTAWWANSRPIGVLINTCPPVWVNQAEVPLL